MASKESPVIIIGAGLAGLVAAYELTKRKIPTLVLDQENSNNIGGQAFWSLGGLFLVNSADQRRYGIKDSYELARRDWMNSAQFDRLESGEDHWPKEWAEAFVRFAADEFEDYVRKLGLSFSTVGWAERGSGRADGHGNSVPRFHLSWGTGPEVVRIFREPVQKAEQEGLIEFRWRHKVDELILDEQGAVVGVKGEILEESNLERGVKSSRVVKDKFEIKGRAVLVSSGGIGGNVDAVKQNWPVHALGPKVPEHFVVGVPAHVDGRMLGISEKAGANIINKDRMWHYTEGLANWNSIWPDHGIRVLPGPSSLWLDANGKRLPSFLYPGCDTRATLKYICSTGYDYTWFILTKSIIAREFALSGSEQNPDITGKSYWGMFTQRVLSSGGTIPVQNFMNKGADFVVRDNIEELVDGMNELIHKSRGILVDYNQIKSAVEERDSQLDNAFCKDDQLMLIKDARNYWPDKYIRVARPHKLLDPSHGPLIAVRMNLLTRKSLGGLETDLNANVLKQDGSHFPGLYAAGEVAGFGGGGVHGYNSLEGTFLGGCIFSGRAAGRAMADLVSSEGNLQSKL